MFRPGARPCPARPGLPASSQTTPSIWRNQVSCRLAYRRDACFSWLAQCSKLSLPRKIGKEFLVSDGLGRGAVGLAVAVDHPRLFQQALFQHAVHSGVDPAVQLITPGKVQPQHQGAVGALGRERGRLLLAEAAAGGPVVLEGAQYPHVVIGVDGRGGLGIDGLQLAVEHGGAAGGQFGGQLFPQAVGGLFPR